MHNPNTSNNLDKWSGPTGEYGSIERLCSVSLRACRLLNPLISAIYEQLLESLKGSTSSSTVQKEKKDNSAFTIADGLVQRLLIQVLFESVSFRDIVGEEDEEDGNKGEDDASWYKVEGLDVPHDLRPLVDSTKSDIQSLAQEHLSNGNDKNYEQLTVFIDPIDGTREFSTGQGHHSTVCIGFANEHGKAVGGVVYRPLSTPKPTYVAGVKSEGYSVYDFGEAAYSKKKGGGLLTTNGSISPFVESLIDELDVPRIRNGGAGNKMMIMLEKSVSGCSIDDSLFYIQDRGVSRWDTCAAEACLEAFGGKLTKMQQIVDSGEEDDKPEDEHYTYLASQNNLDFVPGKANLTKYNCRSLIKDLQPNQMVMNVDQVKPYSNLCGLVAVGKEWCTAEGELQIQKAIQRAATKNAPSFD